jgi:hypothetical protein
MKTAKFIRKLNENQSLYYLSEPIVYKNPLVIGTYTYSYIVASVSYGPYSLLPECCLLAADETGEFSPWIELEGSIRGTTSHEKALNAAGYSLDTNNTSTNSPQEICSLNKLRNKCVECGRDLKQHPSFFSKYMYCSDCCD